MVWNNNLSSEEENEIIQRVAEKIIKYKMETVAILFFTTVRPLAYITGQLGLAFVTPFAPVLNETGVTAEKLLKVFEKRENVEKLISIIEKT